MPPTIETERLLLCGHRGEDLDAVAALWGDPEAMRHIGSPCGRQDSWFRLLRYRGLWPLLGYGYWAIRDKTTGRYVGDVGLADFRRETSPAVPDMPEAGWVLAAWGHGRGLATEAVAGALGWFDRQDARGPVFCLVNAGHQASVRVAEKNGFVRDGVLKIRGNDAVVMVRPA